MKRLFAEWEEQEFVLLAMPHNNSDWKPYLNEAIDNFVEIAKAIAKYQKVILLSTDVENIKSKFSDLSNIEFLEVETNDTWARDFGGITISKDEKLQILDFGFNGWGLKFASNFDNLVTKEMEARGAFKNIKVKTKGMILEGGSIESNGDGVILTTSQCLLEANRNPHLDRKEIEEKLKKYFGAKKVLWLHNGHLENDDTDAHIDTIARFVDKNTIAYIKCDDKSDPHYDSFARMERELEKLKNLDGNPFNLVALPFVGAKYFEGERLPATYANFLIINKAVLVPVYGDENDKKAIEIMKNLFSDRKIIPINCEVLIRQHGSLHCVTMQFPKFI